MRAGGLARTVAAVETIAAAILFAVTVLSFAAVVARYVFNVGIPDAFDGARYLLGTVVFWGIASASYRGEHITMDGVWALSPPALRRVIDGAAYAIVCAALGFFLWKFAGKVVDTWNAGIGTIDLALPVAGFYALALVGLALAQILALVRLAYLLRGAEPPADLGAGAEDPPAG